MQDVALWHIPVQGLPLSWRGGVFPDEQCNPSAPVWGGLGTPLGSGYTPGRKIPLEGQHTVAPHSGVFSGAECDLLHAVLEKGL